MTPILGQHLTTGIAVLDSQHRSLFDLVNEVAPLLAGPDPAAVERCAAALDRLVDFATQHFKTEEGLMRKAGLAEDYVAAHEEKHRVFVCDVEALRSLPGGASGAGGGPSLLRFLTSWLNFHLLDEDLCAARQLELVRVGSAPREAWDQALRLGRADPARVTLVEALDDLNAVVGERSRKLQEANAKLAALAASLEERVAERTRELDATVERMEQTRSQLLQSEKLAAIGQLAAGVAHEINNPVGFVNSNLGSMKKYVRQLFELIDAYAELEAALPEGDPRRQRLERARETADLSYLRQDIVDLLDESEQGLLRVRKIIQDLKDFSHVDEKEWQDADLNAGLESTLNVVWNELKYKAEVVKCFADLPPVRCIAAQINQVFMNLLVNAAQAIERQGTITLTTGTGDGGVWVEIGDTGAGISPEVLPRIFEPFFTTKPVGKGTGLGLSISWDIVVKKHGGRLSVDSVPGQGTRFRVWLPLDGGPAAAVSS